MDVLLQTEFATPFIMKSGVILSCLYNDWASAEVLFQTIDREFSQREWTWQLVLVDDGSYEARPPDFLNSLVSFSSVEIIVLRRNVGHQRAIAIGLSQIFETKNAEAVVVMDADGEDRPEDLARLIEAYSASRQEKIIFAERTQRSEGALFRFLYQIYRALHFSLTGYGIRFGNFSIMPRKLVGCLVVDPNLWLHFAATVVSSHIPYTTIPTQRGLRLHGKSKLNFTSLVIHGLAAISCYNELVGVRLIFCSLGLSALILILIVGVVIERIATPWAIPGWATSAIGISCVLLLQTFLIVLAFIAMAISSRKSQFFFPLQQYKLLIDEVHRIR
jgi:polyisoprenyl-phosphate glycosyltransferase